MPPFTTRIRRWWNKHNTSGGVTLIVTAFIISYVIIVKMDADRPLVHRNLTRTQLQSPLRFRTREGLDVTNDTAPVAGAEVRIFTLPMINNNSREEIDPELSDTTEVIIMTENEQLLNVELQNREEDIEEGWGNYLNREKNNVKNDGKHGQINKQGHLSFQAVHISDANKKMKLNVKSVLPKNVVVYDVFKENKILRDTISKNKCVLLKTLHGDSPICIHDPDFDEIISSSLMETGSWEPNYLYMVGSVLQLNSDIVFLDLGCNIGVYTILAAKLGHPVVAVDPNKKNLRLLTKSLSLGHLSDRVTLLWNAVSDVHENVTVNEIIGNIGGAFVDTAKKDDDLLDVASTLTLDDLSALLADKPVFIKMDIETYELKALQGADNFFKSVEVQYILMEWIAHREGDTGADIIKFMDKHGMYPHINAHHNTKLEPTNFRSWPDNVLWIMY